MSYMYPVLTIAEVICPKNLTYSANRILTRVLLILRLKFWTKNRWRPNLRSEKVTTTYNMTIVSRILLKFFPRIIHAYEQNSARNLNCKISWPQLINWWSLIGEWGVKSVTTHYSKAKLFQEAMFFIMIFIHPKKIYVS